MCRPSSELNERLQENAFLTGFKRKFNTLIKISIGCLVTSEKKEFDYKNINASNSFMHSIITE